MYNICIFDQLGLIKIPNVQTEHFEVFLETLIIPTQKYFKC